MNPNYREIFKADRGELLDIMILNVTPSDWETFLQYLSAHYEISYEEDGVAKPLPRFDMIIERCAEAAVALKVHLSDFTVNCHFFDLDQIEISVLPTEVSSLSKADLVFALMSNVARLLGKLVILVPESSERDQEILRKSALCSAVPKTGEIKC